MQRFLGQTVRSQCAAFQRVAYQGMHTNDYLFGYLVSIQENYPWIGTDKNIFLCVKVISSNPELTRQRKIFLSVPTTDNFPEWKLAFKPGSYTG